MPIFEQSLNSAVRCGLFAPIFTDQRATLVSVNMMAYSILMVIASPIIGWLGDISGTAGTGLLVLAV